MGLVPECVLFLSDSVFECRFCFILYYYVIYVWFIIERSLSNYEHVILCIGSLDLVRSSIEYFLSYDFPPMNFVKIIYGGPSHYYRSNLC